MADQRRKRLRYRERHRFTLLTADNRGEATRKHLQRPGAHQGALRANVLHIVTIHAQAVCPLCSDLLMRDFGAG